MINVNLVDLSKKHKGLAAAHLSAMQSFVSNHFAPIWNLSCTLKLSSTVSKRAWNLLYIDNSDEANALGYHDFLNGYPIGKVFVDTTLRDGESVTVTATHELAEMLADPSANLTVNGPKKLQYAYEVCDAVEETSFRIGNAPVSNFVTPEWFENHTHPSGTKFDYLGLTKKAFQLLSGGYMPVIKNGQWTEIFGSTEKQVRFALETRNGHRSEIR